MLAVPERGCRFAHCSALVALVLTRRPMLAKASQRKPGWSH